MKIHVACQRYIQALVEYKLNLIEEIQDKTQES